MGSIHCDPPHRRYSRRNLSPQRLRFGLSLAILVSVISTLVAAERSPVRRNPSKAEPKQLSVEALVQKIRPSVVVISHFDRDGKEDGVGAGFVISTNGLIATSLHVIGEGRAFKIQFADGSSF